ncbi:MAG: hypothetical protein U0324_24800 [Polyangiales bacterium]
MSQRWSYALLAVLIGCSNSPTGPGPTDADTDAADATPTDKGGDDVADAGGQDAADAGRDAADAGGTDASDVGGTDASDAGGTDASDAGGVDAADAGGTDATDAGGADAADAGGTDASDAGGADAADARVDMCPASRATITLPGTPMNIMATTSGASQVASTTCQSNAGGPEHVYTLTVTERTLATISTDNMGTGFDTVLSLRRTCNTASSEVLCSDDASGASVSLSSRLRGVLEPGTYSLIVDGYNTAMGTYVLSAIGAPPAANGACAGALALTTAGLTGQNLAGALTAPTTCVTGGSGQLYYTVTVPATTQATVRVTPTGTSPTWTPVVRVLDSCDATSCAGNATGSAGMPASITFANSGATSRTYVVSVNANSAGVLSGTFDLALTTAMILPGASCAMAIDVPAGMGRTGESTTGGGPASTVCQTSAGAQRWYRVSIPAGQRLTTTVTPAAASGRSAVVRYLDACDATVCTASTAGVTNMPSALGVNNPRSSARTVYVSVSSDSAATPLSFDLATAVAPVVSTSACDVSASLADGAPVMGDTALGVARPTRCSTADLGPEVFYTVVVPAQRRVSVVAQPASGATWRPRLRGLTGCAATGCFNSTVATADGGPATMALDNPTHLPRTMVVSVSPTTTAAGGPFTITATAAALPTPPVPYFAFSTIAAACDDVSSGATVAPADGWSDDSASALAALPFTFRFFGEDETHFSVTSNGFAQLWPSATGTPSTAYSNTGIPNNGTPNNFVAPFWDDFTTVDAMTTTVRTATVGTAPNRRFVIAWNNWRTLSGTAATERITFQAKLFETTGVIEYHYCSITPTTTRANGDSATVGAEDAMGTRGNLISQDYPNTLTTGVGFRLTPP